MLKLSFGFIKLKWRLNETCLYIDIASSFAGSSRLNGLETIVAGTLFHFLPLSLDDDVSGWLDGSLYSIDRSLMAREWLLFKSTSHRPSWTNQMVKQE